MLTTRFVTLFILFFIYCNDKALEIDPIDSAALAAQAKCESAIEGWKGSP
jgi:hypothetical protein